MAKKILIVEDEAIIALSEARILKKHGYEAVTVCSGEKAVEAAEEILKRHDLPIAFLSSHTEPEVVKKTEGITSYGYIVKNSGETVLLASIKMAFRLYDAHMQLKKQKQDLDTALVNH